MLNLVTIIKNFNIFKLLKLNTLQIVYGFYKIFFETNLYFRSMLIYLSVELKITKNYLNNYDQAASCFSSPSSRSLSISSDIS